MSFRFQPVGRAFLEGDRDGYSASPRSPVKPESPTPGSLAAVLRLKVKNDEEHEKRMKVIEVSKTILITSLKEKSIFTISLVTLVLRELHKLSCPKKGFKRLKVQKYSYLCTAFFIYSL